MKNGWLTFFLLLILSLIWGSSFILIKRGLVGFTPFQLGCLRICIAALVLLPISISNFRKVSFSKKKQIFLFGLCNAGIPAFLFAYAELKISSATAGVLNSLTPIFTLLTGVLFFSIPFSLRKLFGVIIGLFGAILLVFAETDFDSGNLLNESFLYILPIIVATVLYGFSGNIMKNYLDDVPGQTISSLSYLFFGVPLFILLLTTDFFSRVNTQAGLESLFYISLLSIFGSAVAIILLSVLVQKSNALFGSFVTYLIPIVAIGWGYFEQENINALMFAGLLVILTGIFVASPYSVNLFKKIKVY